MTSESIYPLDETDWRLLVALQEQARLSYTELGRRVGLSAPAVTERMRKLEDAGVIAGYHAELNLAKAGLPITAYMRMSTPREESPRVAERLREVAEVLECARVAGPDSFIIKVGVASIPHLEALIDRLAQYGQSSTSIVLSTPVPRRIVEQR